MATRIQQFPFGVGGVGGLNDVVDDLTPQLGGNLDLNTRNILASVATGPAMIDVASSTLVATLIPDRASPGAGVGGTGGDVSIITTEGEAARFTNFFAPGPTNFLEVRASGVGGNVDLIAEGVDTNVTLALRSKGTDPINFQVGVNLEMSVTALGLEAFQTNGPAMDNVGSALVAVFRPNKQNLTTGLGSNSTGSFAAMIHNGAEVFRFNSAGHLSLANINTVLGASLFNEVPTITNPTVLMNGAFPASGLGGAGADPSMINAGAEKMRWGGSITTFLQNMEALDAAGPQILNVASTGSVATVRPNRGTVAGLGGSGGAVDIITGSGLSGIRVGTGPGQVNSVLQASGTSGLFLGSVSGSFGLHNVASSATVPSLLNNFLSEVAGIGGVAGAVSMIAASVERVAANATGLGFFATPPVARPTGVAVTAAGVHAALVTLGLITA